MQLDTESLRTFLTVLETGGMTRAAAELDVSQSAVSLRMRRLEERVGAALLERDGHRFGPTPIGASLLPYAQRLVVTHDDAVARLTHSGLAGTVRLGTGDERFAERVTSVLGRFRHAHPNATVKFLVEQSRILTTLLAKGELDMVLTVIDQREVLATDRVLWTDELVWVIGEDIYFDGDTIPLIAFSPGSLTRDVAEATLHQAAQRFDLVFSGWSSESLASALRAGVGVALTTRRSIPDGVTIWDRNDDFPTTIDVAYVARFGPENRSPLLDELATDLCSELADPPYDEPETPS